MKIAYTISSIDKRDGGPSNSVNQLCEYAGRLAGAAEIHTLDTPFERVETQNQVSFYPVFGPSRLGFAPSMKRGVARSLSQADVLHNNGLWMGPNLIGPWVQRRTNCKLVTSPRGTLAQWSLKKSALKKQWMLRLGQQHALHVADALHATAEQEYQDIRRFGLRQPVCILPNGIEIPNIEALNVANRADTRTLLYLGRVHSQKGIGKLLDLWPALALDNPGWNCVICGPGEEGYVQEVRAQIERIGPTISYREPVYGSEKTQLLAQASLFVLPSETENFGIAVAEALAHGTPVVVSREAPWGGVEEQACGWWAANTHDGYKSALNAAMHAPQIMLDEMGVSGRLWMQRSFSWQEVAEQMVAMYRWLLGSGDRPDCVVVD